MSDVALIAGKLPATPAPVVDRLRRLEHEIRKRPQLPVETHHVLHGGMYARTITIPAGCVLTGALIRVPTLLIMDGHATVSTGGDVVTMRGRHVLAGSRGRKQAFCAHEDTHLTMVFATSARTVAEAEDEFTEDAHLLLSRQPGAVNHFVITGE
jgi:hypothetical protein